MKRFFIFVSIGFVGILCAAGCCDTGSQTPGRGMSARGATQADIPEATSYSGNFGITLVFDQPDSLIFKSEVLVSATGSTLITPDSEDFDAAQKGRFDAKAFPHLQWISNENEQAEADSALNGLDYDEFKNQYEAGKYLVLYRTQAGTMVYDFVEWRLPEPELFLLEEYRLTSHLGDYGTGRIINTMSLLPGEKTTYQIHKYSSVREMEAATSSIFDSRSEESAESFQEAVLSEESNLDRSSKSFHASASVSASAGWGWGKAKASASSSYATNSSREEFARNVSSAVNNHARRASANRSVEVSNASTRERVDEKEDFITKEVANPNLSRTLNFIFYQMNQEFITFLHLVEVSIGLLDANGDVTIVPLHDLQSLLDLAVVDTMHTKVREQIIFELTHIRDFEGEIHRDFVICDAIDGTGKRGQGKLDSLSYRLAPKYMSTHRGAGGRTIQVPGIIVAVNTVVLQTDGIFVDALLGNNSALADIDEQADAARLWQMRYGTAKE